jgi:hypothetical protein
MKALLLFGPALMELKAMRLLNLSMSVLDTVLVPTQYP